MATPACVAASYCKACSTTTVTECAMCFNYKLGTIGARYKTGTTCTNSLSAISNCNTYNPDLTVSTVASTGACQTCDSDYAVVETTTAGVIAVTCVDLPTGCADITDCMQVVCKTSNAGTTYASTCGVCDSGKGHSAANACAATIITNCDYTTWSGTVQNCKFADSGYAVASTMLTAVAYTTDSNCQTLATTVTTDCQVCWDGYYWNTTVCLLSAKLLGAAFLAVVALFIN
jgi:hypothetical protein